MDYKELAKQLRRAVPYNGTWLQDRMREAATAIETLSAERDAAVEELRGECRVCERRGECLFNDQYRDECGNGSNWQWRGPQKGAGDE